MEEIARLAIPALPAFVGVARTAVVAAASSVQDIDDERLEDLRIAVSEACTNAVEAHQDSDTEDRVMLRCLLDDDRLEVQIEDSGPGFDTAAIPERRVVRKMEDLDSERGWGIQLIRALVDEAVFRTSDGGMQVHLVIKRGGI